MRDLENNNNYKIAPIATSSKDLIDNHFVIKGLLKKIIERIMLCGMKKMLCSMCSSVRRVVFGMGIGFEVM